MSSINPISMNLNCPKNSFKPSFCAQVPIATEDLVALSTGKYLKKLPDEICTDIVPNWWDSPIGPDRYNALQNGLIKQFPVLATIRENANTYFKNTRRSTEEVTNWLKAQTKRLSEKDTVNVEQFDITI